MIRSFRAAVIIGGLVLSSICFGYSGGSGTPEDPYLISTAEDMNQIGLNYTDWDKYFILTADISLSACTGTQFNRIGTDAKHAFSGVFDGDGHTISNFTYTAETGDYIGIFGNVDTFGMVGSVSLVNVNVVGRNYVGGLVGYSRGAVINCNSTGAVTGAYYVGGLVGYNGGSINNCYSTGNVNGGYNSQYLGGLVGINCEVDMYYYGGAIFDCCSTGNVTGGAYSRYLGGLVGWNFSRIGDCYSIGNVTGGDYSYDLGGLVGYNGGGDDWYYNNIVSYCYSTSVVSGGYNSDCLGGLLGENGEQGYVADCYATGEVAGDYDAGGLVGINDHGYIYICYSSGSVSGYMFVGGLLGWNYGGGIMDSFWDVETSGQSWSAGGTGKTTAEMMTKSTFTDAGWDFMGETDNGTEDIWRLCVDGVKYPLLWWQFSRADFICPDGVNFVDYSFFAERWLNTDCANNNYCDGTDFDFSDTVDMTDLETFCSHWLEGL